MAVVFLWGSSFAFIKIALQSLTPLGVSLGRLVIAAIALLILSGVTRTRLPPRRLWGLLVVNGMLASALPWLLTAVGETSISSALTAIIGSTGPLFTLLAISMAFPEERPTRERIAGLCVGFIGVLVVVGVWHGIGAASLTGIVAVLVANMIWGWSAPFSRRYLTGGALASDVSPMSLATGMFVVTSIAMAPWMLIAPVTKSTITAAPLVAILVLGVLCSAVAAVMNFRVIGRADATTASTVLYVTPLVAVVLGFTFLGESISWNQPLGGVVILCGAALAQGLIRLPSRQRHRARLITGEPPG